MTEPIDTDKGIAETSRRRFLRDGGALVGGAVIAGGRLAGDPVPADVEDHRAAEAEVGEEHRSAVPLHDAAGGRLHCQLRLRMWNRRNYLLRD